MKIIDLEEYRAKKRDALTNKSRSTKAETYKGQRDILFYVLHKVFKQDYSKLSRLCKEYGYSVDRTTIYDVITSKNKEVLKDEVEEEIKKEKEKEIAPIT